MLFSIIVPIYNVEKYINQCIESALSQTYKDFELILVDDGSPDKCPQICDEYAEKDSRVKVIHKKNGGVTEARKVGTQKACGDYVILLDGDDWISCDCCDVFASIVQQYHPDVICADYYRAVSNQRCIVKKIGERHGFYDRKKIIADIIPHIICDKNGKSFSGNICAKAFKRNIFCYYQNLVDNDIVVGEDAATVKSIVFNSTSLFVTDKPLYYYRMNPNSMTMGKNIINWNNPELRARVMEESMDVSSYDIQKQIYRSTVHSFFNVMVSQFYGKKGYFKTKKEILKRINENDYYKLVIEKANFKIFSLENLILKTLKYKLISLIFLYSKIKRK